MRTKTLLIAAAALVAGIISPEAQSVYSPNIVGYVTLPCPSGVFVLAANPLDNGTNDLNSLGAALPTKSSAQYWNGSGFVACSKIGSTWTPDPTLAPGTGFFLKSASTVTNTFTGNVIAAPGGGTVTNNLSANVFYLVGSPIPYSTDLNDTNNTLNLSELPNKSSAQVWNGTSFVAVSKIGANWTPDETILPGTGLFIKVPSATNWVQTLQ